MTVYKAERIADLLEQGLSAATTDPFGIVPTPDLTALRESGAGSVDLRLGTWFAALRQARRSHLAVRDGAAESELSRTSYVRFGESYFLHPGGFVLAVSLEWIRLPSTLCAYVIGKSSWGRRGLIIATAVGVHPGFKGCLTLELTNVGELTMELKPGMAIGQLFVHRVEDSSSERVDRSRFIGLRRPTVGGVETDAIAEKLAGGGG